MSHSPRAYRRGDSAQIYVGFIVLYIVIIVTLRMPSIPHTATGHTAQDGIVRIVLVEADCDGTALSQPYAVRPIAFVARSYDPVSQRTTAVADFRAAPPPPFASLHITAGLYQQPVDRADQAGHQDTYQALLIDRLVCH